MRDKKYNYEPARIFISITRYYNIRKDIGNGKKPTSLILKF